MTDAFLDSPLFTKWTDPKTGVVSHILAKKAAPLQQSFYYTNPSLSADGRFYWFYASFPPAGSASYGRCLGVADFRTGEVRVFPETQFSHASPMLDPDTGEAYWANHSGIWKRTPETGAVLVARYPAALTRNRPVTRYATHLTMSADRKALNIDGDIGDDCVVGRALLDGGGIEIWQTLDFNYNHAQFHPRDPDLLLVAQDYRVDRKTGRLLNKENRLWTIRRGGQIAPVYAEAGPAGYASSSTNSHLPGEPARTVTDRRGMHGHEWWGMDGDHLWYVHYKQGVERLRLGKTEPELVWPHSTVSHAHSNAAETHLVLDSLPLDVPDDRRVTFVNLETGRDVNLVSFMPDPPEELRRYHLHPHPQFCGGDRLVCYTTMVLGSIDVAFARVDDLVARTS